MADTREVLKGLNTNRSNTKLLAIVANLRGAEEALSHPEIDYLGFPFSISPTFQMRNANRTIEESLVQVEEIQNLCVKNQKQLVIYLSMGFGNPYGDPYNEEILLQWADAVANLDITIISLADTVGLAAPAQISFALQALIPKYLEVVFGVHLHSGLDNRKEKLEAALQAGCKRFDGALKGIGGCPMAQDELVGNMDTLYMIDYFKAKRLLESINENALQKSVVLANKIFV
jgi:hydroxymethylglutaryl-CoA lyase